MLTLGTGELSFLSLGKGLSGRRSNIGKGSKANWAQLFGELVKVVPKVL